MNPIVKQLPLLPMEEFRFIFSYQADDNQLDKHRMEASLLADTIKSTANLIQRADEIINGSGNKSLNLYVSAPAKSGSLCVEFITTFINYDGASAVLSALGVMTPAGFVGAALANNILKAAAAAKGQEIISVQTNDDEKDKATIELADGQQFEATPDVAKLIASPKVREHIKHIVANPLAHKDSPVFKIQAEDSNQKTINTSFVLNETEIKAIKQLKTNSFAPRIDRITANGTFHQINFDSKTGWKIAFTSHQIVSVILDDEEFLKNIQANQQSFKKDDTYQMVVEITTHTNDLGNESKKYRLIQVLPIQPR